MTGPADILRSNRTGVLMAGERAFPVLFVTAHDGALVAPLEGGAIEAGGHTLFVPEESVDALQLLVRVARLGPDPAAADRWRAYHGTARSARWCAMSVESGRRGAEVVDGAGLMLVNPLADAEGALCRRVNSDAAALRRAVLGAAGVDVPHPLCVGVDDHGMDVRARFGIVRVGFERPAGSAGEAMRVIEGLLGLRG
ncbi:MAG: hypothetical protein IT437_01960 [Phycisphaerales bacterium]|nr:hypothetical protein [Phycisphaerales bacterium]